MTTSHWHSLSFDRRVGEPCSQVGFAFLVGV